MTKTLIIDICHISQNWMYTKYVYNVYIWYVGINVCVRLITANWYIGIYKRMKSTMLKITLQCYQQYTHNENNIQYSV